MPAPRRHRATTPMATLVALAGLALLTLGPTGLALAWHERTQQQQPAGEQAANPLGTEVRDDAAAFVVHELRCGPDPDAKHGRRCLMTVRARNHGEARLTIPAIAQVLHSPRGVRHQPVASDPEPFGTLEPGTAATAVIEYDVPLHVRITRIGVHAGAYSDGATVSLPGPPLPLLPDS